MTSIYGIYRLGHHGDKGYANQTFGKTSSLTILLHADLTNFCLLSQKKDELVEDGISKKLNKTSSNKCIN